MSTYSTSPSPAKTKGDRPSSTSSDDPGVKQSPAKPDKPDKPEKKERSGRKESKKDKSKTAVPPVEASQPPPGPLVPLGRPKERVLKRPRSVTLSPGWLIKTDPPPSFSLLLLSFVLPQSFISLFFLPSSSYLIARWIILGIWLPITCACTSRVQSLLENFPVLYSVSALDTHLSIHVLTGLLCRALSSTTPAHVAAAC